jgi:hypothetical protein
MKVDPAPTSSVTLGRAASIPARAGEIASISATVTALIENLFIVTRRSDPAAGASASSFLFCMGRLFDCGGVAISHAIRYRSNRLE